MKTSAALRKTLRYLSDGVTYEEGKSVRICYAADRAGNKVQERVVPIITCLLGRHVYFEDWLKAKGIKCYGPANTRKLQATRKAWLLHLIAEYEAKGD